MRTFCSLVETKVYQLSKLNSYQTEVSVLEKMKSIVADILKKRN